MDEAVIEKIVEEYEAQTEKNIRERDQRVREVYKKIPEIEKIDDEINRIGSSTLKKILSDPDNGDIKIEMENKFKILSQRKKELIEKNNIPADYDKLHYKCSLCKDTGYVEGQGRCSCFKQKLINNLYMSSNMNELLKKQNFDTYDPEVFGKEKIKGLKYSPYENMQIIRRVCEKFADNIDEPGKNIIFHGDTGLGKTFMSSCIAKRVMDSGHTVIYIRASRLFKILDDERFGRAAEGLENIYNSDLLIIDDLGTELSSKNNSSYLFDLVNERLTGEKKIIINTNLNFEGLEKLYTKRFTSRIMESFEMLYFYGEDIRRKKFLKK